MNFKSIEYESIAVNLVKAEQRDEAYLKINPNGLLPTLQLPDSSFISESTAIVEYLEEVYPQDPLIFGTPTERAKAVESDID